MGTLHPDVIARDFNVGHMEKSPLAEMNTPDSLRRRRSRPKNKEECLAELNPYSRPAEIHSWALFEIFKKALGVGSSFQPRRNAFRNSLEELQHILRGRNAAETEAILNHEVAVQKYMFEVAEEKPSAAESQAQKDKQLAAAFVPKTKRERQKEEYEKRKRKWLRSAMAVLPIEKMAAWNWSNLLSRGDQKKVNEEITKKCIDFAHDFWKELGMSAHDK